MAWQDFNNMADIAAANSANLPIPSKKKKGNFITSLLPSAGGIGGGVAGAAIGTAILPGIGTLIGAGLGGALGGGGGKVAENKIEGNALGSGVAGEAAINGVLGAGPLRLLKGGVDVARGLKAGTGLADAVTQAGSNAVNASATKAIGNRLSKSGQNLIAKEFRLNPTQQANFKNLTGEEATSVLRRYGIKKPEDLTAKIQPLQDAFDHVVTQVPNISKKELQSGLASVYDPLLKSPALFEQNLGQQIKAQADELVKRAGTEGISATDVNGLRKTFDNAVSYTQKGAPEYNVIEKTAHALRGTLQRAADRAGVKSAEGSSFKDIGLELRKLRQLNDVVGKQSYLGSGNLPLGIPNLLATAAGGASGGLPGAALAGGATQLINSNMGRRLAANGIIKAGEKLTAKAATSSPYGVGAVASRIAPVGLADALLGQSPQSDGNNMATNATTTNTTTMPNSDQNMGPLSQTSSDSSSATIDPNSPFAPQNLETSIKHIISKGGTLKDATDFISLADAIQKMQSPSSAKLNATQLQQANNANSGLGDLQTIAQEIQGDPSVLIKDAIPGGSIARRLTGTNNYDAAKQNVVDVIARLRSGAAITADEAQRYLGLLPGAADTPQSAVQKLQRLSSLLSSFANPEAAQPDLSSALMAAQGGYAS